jgi:hypothetical protein
VILITAGNYHLIEKGFTGETAISPGITNSWTRNPPKECLFHRESPAQGLGIHRRNGIPQGSTNSVTLIQTGKIKMRGNPLNSNNSRISMQLSIFYTANAKCLNNLNTKTSFKLIKNLTRTYKELHIFPIKKKDSNIC